MLTALIVSAVIVSIWHVSVFRISGFQVPLRSFPFFSHTSLYARACPFAASPFIHTFIGAHTRAPPAAPVRALRPSFHLSVAFPYSPSPFHFSVSLVPTCPSPSADRRRSIFDAAILIGFESKARESNLREGLVSNWNKM